MKSDNRPVKIRFGTGSLSDDELQKVSGGAQGGDWREYWCDACNCPHILDYPNTRCPLTNTECRPWGH